MRILFVTHNRIGDAVLSTGLLSWLAERHPEARITVACGPAPAPLFAPVPFVERVHVMRKRRYAGHWFTLWRAVFGRWDMIVDLRGSALAYGLPAGARHVLRPARTVRHRVAHLADLFAIDPPPSPRLWLDPADVAEAARLLPAGPAVLALGPTANWGGKQWPADRFAALASGLTGPGGLLAGARIAVFGAPGERQAAQPVLDALPPERRIDLVGAAGLPVIAACLARAALFVGNDSGLMHMAAAVGTPTLGLFGPSREDLYAPWGDRVASVRTDRSYAEIRHHPDYDYRQGRSWMQDLPVERVRAAAETLLAAEAGTCPGAARS